LLYHRGGDPLKRVFIILVLVVVCILLFACSGDTADAPTDALTGATESSDTQEEPTSNEPATPEPSPEPTPSAEQPETDAVSGATEVLTPATGEVVISFEYTRQSGPASNQHAIWIEDMDGNLIKSLFASRWTANGGFATRPDSIAIWAERAGLASMSSAEVDAVAGATPSTGPQSYIWDLTDLNGGKVLKGDYMFFVEGTLRWKNYVLYSGVITIGETPVTVQGSAHFHFESSERYAALNVDSPENEMIGSVTVTFTP